MVLSIQRASRATRRIFFGWWIVLSGIGVQALIGALSNQAYGVYIVVLKEQFGWSPTAFSIGFAVQRAVSGTISPAQGWLLDRIGPRVVMSVGFVLLAIGFALFSQINSLTGFYLVVMILGVGTAFAGFMSVTVTLVNWFERKRGTALGVMQTGGALGGLLLPLVAWSIETNGWESTALASSILFLLIGVPLAQIMRRTPEDYGLHPDGVRTGVATISSLNPEATPEPRREGFTARQAIRTRTFWYLAIAHGLAVIIVTTVSLYLVLYLTSELGLSLAGASLVVSVMTIMMMAGQLVGGILGDRYSKRWLTTGATIGQSVAMLLLAFSVALPMVIVAVILQGWSHGLRGVLMMPIRADYFGTRAFGTIMGFSFFIMMGGEIVGPIIMGITIDAFSSYRPGFIMLSIAGAIGAVLFALSSKPSLPRP